MSGDRDEGAEYVAPLLGVNFVPPWVIAMDAAEDGQP